MTTLYRLFDADGALLYVGISDRWTARVRQHERLQPWWSRVVSVVTESYDTRQDAEEAERSAIKTERPAHNVIGVVVTKPILRRRPDRPVTLPHRFEMIIDGMTAIGGPEQRLAAIQTEMRKAEELRHRLVAVRADAIEAAREAGTPWQHLADIVNVTTVERVRQMVAQAKR